MAEPDAACERDGNVAVDDPVQPAAQPVRRRRLEALAACVDEVEGSDARALVWRAEGDVFTGGVDVQQLPAGQSRRAPRSGLFGSLIPVVQRLEALPIPTLGPGPRPLPDRRPGDLAGLRHDLGDRVRPLRPGRGGRRPDARRGRDAADGRARRTGAGAPSS